jgi:hypothetical protein
MIVNYFTELDVKSDVDTDAQMSGLAWSTQDGDGDIVMGIDTVT